MLEVGGRNGVVGEIIGERGFAEFEGVKFRGQDDVGDDALLLGGTAGHTIEFLDGELDAARVAVKAKRGAVLERDDGLDGAFAVGALVADDDGAAIVLQGAGDDFGGGGAGLVDQDEEGAAVDLVRVFGLELVDVVVGAPNLDDGPVDVA